MESLIHYNKEKFLRGGIYAALPPIIIGICLAITLIAKGQLSTSVYLLPVIISFVFVTPIIAALSVLELKKRSPFNKNEIFKVGLKKSSIANFYVALLYNVVFSILLDSELGGHGIIQTMGMVFIFGGFIQLILWLVVTTPLTMLCTSIFEYIVRTKNV